VRDWGADLYIFAVGIILCVTLYGQAQLNKGDLNRTRDEIIAEIHAEQTATTKE
jgi:hypothetical protein